MQGEEVQQAKGALPLGLLLDRLSAAPPLGGLVNLGQARCMRAPWFAGAACMHEFAGAASHALHACLHARAACMHAHVPQLLVLLVKLRQLIARLQLAALGGRQRRRGGCRGGCLHATQHTHTSLRRAPHFALPHAQPAATPASGEVRRAIQQAGAPPQSSQPCWLKPPALTRHAGPAGIHPPSPSLTCACALRLAAFSSAAAAPAAARCLSAACRCFSRALSL